MNDGGSHSQFWTPTGESSQHKNKDSLPHQIFCELVHSGGNILFNEWILIESKIVE